MINSNKGCFWIDVGSVADYFGIPINSNKGCFWIAKMIEAHNDQLRLTVTKVVFELEMIKKYKLGQED